MKKALSKLAVKVLNKSLRAEADSACALLGYQPRMPETVKNAYEVTNNAMRFVQKFH